MDADEALNEYVRRLVRGDGVDYIAGLPRAHADRKSLVDHYTSCPDLVVRDAEGSTGTYGCDTGCEFARLEAQILCPHQPGPVEVEYGWFGDMSYICDELDKIRAEAGGEQR